MNDKAKTRSRTWAPMPIAIVAGAVIGSATDNLVLWISIGVAIGAAITGTVLFKKP